MYNELYETWKLELENKELQKLPAEFYSTVANYMKKLREEGRMLEKRTLKANLLRKEMQNAKHMAQELIQIRYRKIMGKVARGEQVAQDLLTLEEKTIYSRAAPFAETVQNFASEVVRGQTPKMKMDQQHKKVAVRFLKDVPAIIGADMKTYGPFKVEDVAMLPAENTRILITQGLVEKVETD